jgi:hypothetical protein
MQCTEAQRTLTGRHEVMQNLVNRLSIFVARIKIFFNPWIIVNRIDQIQMIDQGA